MSSFCLFLLLAFSFDLCLSLLTCTPDGTCTYTFKTEDEGTDKQHTDSDTFRCTKQGQCESDDLKFETRVSATGQAFKDKALRLFFEVWAADNFDLVEEFVHTGHVFTSPMLARPLIGIDGLIQFNELIKSSFSDYSFFIDNIIHEEGTVVVRFQFFGINSGEFGGVPPTGRFIRVPDCLAVFSFWQDKIHQSLVVWPHQSIMSQLGHSTKYSFSPDDLLRIKDVD
eukprot:CAMPEP_0174273246 /NCGR_PEP_ID=MMETSP0439-20130205/53892_1 /TAXON_ID=0 /ORGANISM="Stereomyxa ramosa, Strain Chinc5" /LENGTH=225 /DNA_ID=CAMNT_0015364273 /DNA_START=74 /DNA_END=751 /DNA_ORIENTATION=-